MFYILFAFATGLVVPIQTAVNSRLRTYVLSPFVASFVSFSVGTIFLLFMTLITKHTLLIDSSVILNEPKWIWIGGILGLIGLTANILLFPVLGGVQTVVLPIMGQIIMSIIVDHFGLFHAPSHALTPLRFIGLLVLVLGVIMVIVLPDWLRKRKQHYIAPDEQSISKLPFQISGIIAGMLMATQSAINGELGHLLNSPVHAAFVSFFIGTVFLFIIVTFIRKEITQIRFAIGKDKPKWIWIGGILGSFFVFGMSYLVPIIGTGLVVIICLFGQIICSILLDSFGWIGAKQKKVTGVQYLGLAFIFLAIVLIRMN
ncbi:DMT family transporter [Macrococcus sp. CCM 2573]